jgi:hypothetical protein
MIKPEALIPGVIGHHTLLSSSLGHHHLLCRGVGGGRPGEGIPGRNDLLGVAGLQSTSIYHTLVKTLVTHNMRGFRATRTTVGDAYVELASGLAQGEACQTRDGVGDAVGVDALATQESRLNGELVLATDLGAGGAGDEAAQAHALQRRR